LRILFVFRHGGYVRNFESLLVELARRGHHVHALLGHSRLRWLEGRRPPIEIIAEAHPNITWSIADDTGGPLARYASGLRVTLDWLRYLDPMYAHAPRLRARVEDRVPRRLRRALLGLGADRRAIVRRILALLERTLPPPAGLRPAIAGHQPDLVCVTPLVDMGNTQPDVLRVTRALGIPSVLCVASWDNLTNKGLIRGEPDVVTVWNEFQRREAVELHRQPPDVVVATGAQSYDHWFTWRPERTREAFCAEVGLAPDRPFVVFLGSSRFIAPNGIEVGFVRRWLAALRAADAPVRDVGVVVRPHPQNGGPWREADLSDLDGVAVWPRSGADPIDDASRADFHDTLEFCTAVVGINTSALIESAVVGRPVLTILAPEFEATQEGTIHFEHLRRAGGGVLVEAPNFERHIEQLATVLRGDDGFAARNRSFLQAFVRPHGLDRPAAPILADTLERAAAAGPRTRPARGLAGPPVRLAWRALEALERARAARRPAGAAAAAAKTARGDRKLRKAQPLQPTEVGR
jgi:hypothetical protein